jgi:AcrR family transcriptional regulator
MSDQRRVGAYPEAARALLRDTVIDAVHHLVRDRGWANTTMADVARVAGVSRQTVYNEFGSRGELAQAYVLWETERFVDEVSEAVRNHPHDIEAALTAAVEVFLRAAANDPLFKSAFLRDGDDSLLALLTTQGAPVLALATGQLSLLFAQLWPAVSAEDAELLTEQVVRLGISHAALPTAPVDVVAAGITRVLAPFAQEAVARATGGKSAQLGSSSSST